ncbi:hypothetical protein [Pedobacter ureilyticus]|uniref:Uncharacterized protein n=1 Tax=Pedobacter ureilyticus TaxID=1393051 RepID=A0ABW9J5H1_9SPHI|nr:hypothetical protein [Pedobacter helvus]
MIQFGAKTADESAPFGDDSSPLSNMIAVYADTGEIGEPVIIGYLNEMQLAKPGEKRLYSLKSDGSLSFYAWLHNDGTMELGGKVDNLVRYIPLSTGLAKHNTELSAELAKISLAIGSLGGSYTPGAVTMDVSGSKINEIKTL